MEQLRQPSDDVSLWPRRDGKEGGEIPGQGSAAGKLASVPGIWHGTRSSGTA